MGDNKKTAVFGIFTTVASADNATDSLVKSGFSASDISALLPENLGTKQIGTEKATKAPEGATAGAGTGAVLGGALGLLAGIGALAIPGVGPLIAAGPNYGCSCRNGRRWGSRGHGWSTGRSGHSRVRGKAL